MPRWPVVLIVASISLAHGAGAASRDGAEWPIYGGPGQTRYSSLKRINRSNVSRLQVAWMYDTAEGPNAAQTHPIVINGVLFGLTPKHKVIALDAATGKLLWRFDSGIDGRGPNRGVVYWSDGAERRIFASIQSYLYALDARTGTPIASFGANG